MKIIACDPEEENAQRLSTRVANTHSVRCYERHGYAQIENYGKYSGRSNSICFEKHLGSGLIASK